MALRAMPRPGGAVMIDYLGATVSGIVSEVTAEGRELEVVTEDGSRIRFALNGATATFTAEGAQTGARLRFVRPG